MPLNLFSKSNSQLRKIALTELVSILHRACQLSIVERSEKSLSWDYDRCLPYLVEHNLQEHVTIVKGSFKKLPLNSERHLYAVMNIVIRNLHIHFDDRSAWTAHDDWEPLSGVKWHFENCFFDGAGTGSYILQFPWSSSFRFYKNKFDFDSDESGPLSGNWLFEFQNGSRVLFQQNDFRNRYIQTRCVPAPQDRDEADTEVAEFSYWGEISLVGNRAIANLGILEGYSSVSFTGMNHIASLWFMSFRDSDSHDETRQRQEPKVYFGPREKIDRHFHHCLGHRKMFLSLRRLAVATHDTRQVVVLDKQIDRIEYFLNKDRDAPSPVDFRNWIEYWQDRLLYAWRRWSSDFYKSWMRPLSMILLGYMLMNAVPAIFVDAYSWSHWIEFNLRPLGEIPQYEQSLKGIVGAEYRELSSSVIMSFKLLGLIQVIWIAMWSFAFARSIRR